ncbi:MAG: hypothetical protein ACOCYR_08390 [Erythrobacter sp.]
MPSPSSRFTAGLAAAALAVTAAPAAAYDFPCFEDDLVESARIHDLRVLLMVSALKCRFDNPATLRDYTDLLDSREEQFSHHGHKVREDLMERFGPVRGNAEFHTYNTRLSNYHSKVQPTAELCGDASAFMRLARRADDAELATLSALATNRTVSACPVSEARFAPAEPAEARERDPFAAVPEPSWQRAAPSPAAEPEVEMVDGVPTYSAPNSLPGTRPEPLERVDLPAQVAAAETAAGEAAASGDDAKVDQAIAALAAAVEALKQLKTTP